MLLLLVTACSGTTKKPVDFPAWISGGSQHYPSSLYLTGQGTGLTLNDAKERARTDLAKQFQVTVQERSHQSQQFQSQQVQGETSSSLNQQVSRSLLSYTSRSLEGVEIVRQWHNKQTNQYYALAALSRPKANRQFSQQISGLDKEIQQTLGQARQETNNLHKASLLQSAIEAYQQRMALQRSLQVVDPTGRGIPATITLAELENIQTEFISRIKLSTMVVEATDDSLPRILNAELSRAGFTMTGPDKADYHLVLETLLDPIIQEQNWFWLRGTLELRLKEPGGNTVGVQRWPLKVSATTKPRAKQRLVDAVQEILAKNLLNEILGFAKPKLNP